MMGCHLVSDVLGGSGMIMGDKVEREEVEEGPARMSPGKEQKMKRS